MQSLLIATLSFGIYIAIHFIIYIISHEYRFLRKRSEHIAERRADLKAAVLSLCDVWFMSKGKDLCDLRTYISDRIRDIIVPYIAYYENAGGGPGNLRRLCMQSLDLCSQCIDLNNMDWCKRIEAEMDRICKLFKAEIRRIM